MPTFAIPETLRQAKAILSHLNFAEVPDETLKNIAAVEGHRFKEAITALANRSGEDLDAKNDYVHAVVEAASQRTAEIIETALGFEPIDQQTRLAINKEEGSVFLVAIRSVADKGADAVNETNYLNRVLCGYSKKIRPAASVRPIPQRTSTEPIEVAQAAAKGIASRPATTEPEGTEAERPFENTHIYGGKGAICLTADTIRKTNKPTIRIEGANGSGDRSYDWRNKIAIQLSIGEMVLLYGVLMGYLQKLEVSGHGDSNEKGFIIEDQGKHYFVSMFCKGRAPCAVPAKAKDIHVALSLIWDQIKANNPTQADETIQMHIKRTCEKHAQDIVAPAQKRA